MNHKRHWPSIPFDGSNAIAPPRSVSKPERKPVELKSPPMDASRLSEFTEIDESPWKQMNMMFDD